MIFMGGHNITLIKITSCEHLLACYYPLANEVAKGYSNATVLPSHPCGHPSMDFDQTVQKCIS
jgi:hypothetical protein